MNRNSLVVIGCVSWNVGGDARASIVLSFPEGFRIKPIEGFKDVIDDRGYIAKRFVNLLGNVQQVISEHAGDAVPGLTTSA